MLVREGELVGLIDFEFAGFFDPVLEFLAPFGWTPELRNLRLEERYFERCGFDVGELPWYRAVSLLGWWLGLLADPESDYPGYTASLIREELERWIEETAA
jgi:aminoglycoside phosphotransferase (APT) family kinase protein